MFGFCLNNRDQWMFLRFAIIVFPHDLTLQGHPIIGAAGLSDRAAPRVGAGRLHARARAGAGRAGRAQVLLRSPVSRVGEVG